MGTPDQIAGGSLRFLDARGVMLLADFVGPDSGAIWANLIGESTFAG
ncbi:hypothetical protein DSM3645_18276 [Blastopirellula marina DSM 3645]|uniref:Uncharacterized protein n=1 Tax=Blastopirellula marina DSM 3645 TaxID=314230 RepID=A3ZYU9_9BACT|nr:hypothetical protein DSM3645_18276 [Blastopirellula marina DSM 3645]